MNQETLQYLLGYNIWADNLMLNAARRLTPEQLHAPHQMGFGPVFDTLAHIMGAQKTWLTRWQGESPTALPPTSAYQDLDQLAAESDAVHSDLEAFIRGLEPERLNSTITYKTTKGEQHTEPLLLLILHVFNHSTEHRSQVAAMCTMAGHDTGPQDLIHYMRTVNPVGR